MEKRSSQVNFKGEANNSQRYGGCQLSWTLAGSKLSCPEGIKGLSRVPECIRTDQKDRPEASIIQMKCNREISTGDQTAGTRTCSVPENDSKRRVNGDSDARGQRL